MAATLGQFRVLNISEGCKPMKQIKTVILPIEQAKLFDELVNCLLIDGWQLKERKTINGTGELSEAFNASVVRFLYADLERQEPPFPEEMTF